MTELQAWTNGFGPSRHGRDIWFVRSPDIEPPPGVAFQTSLSRMRAAYTTEVTWEFADGYLLRTNLHIGTWVRGWATMRYLCLINGFSWPERALRGEPFVPDPELLAFAVAEWSRTGSHYHYGNPYERPVSVAFEHHERFWSMLASIHTAEGIALPAGTDGRRCAEADR